MRSEGAGSRVGHVRKKVSIRISHLVERWGKRKGTQNSGISIGVAIEIV